METFDAYKKKLIEISAFLESVDEKRWSARLQQWVRELDSSADDKNKHLLRTRNALGGMGSIGDIFISHRNGLAKSFKETELPQLNRRLISLIQSLNSLIGELISDEALNAKKMR